MRINSDKWHMWPTVVFSLVKAVEEDKSLELLDQDIFGLTKVTGGLLTRRGSGSSRASNDDTSLVSAVGSLEIMAHRHRPSCFSRLSEVSPASMVSLTSFYGRYCRELLLVIVLIITLIIIFLFFHFLSF